MGLDVVIANGENSAGGSGITPETAAELYDAGVDVITSGDHLWDQKEVAMLLENEPRFLRSEEHTSELQSQSNLVCRLLLEKKKDHGHVERIRFDRQRL